MITELQMFKDRGIYWKKEARKCSNFWDNYLSEQWEIEMIDFLDHIIPR